MDEKHYDPLKALLDLAIEAANGNECFNCKFLPRMPDEKLCKMCIEFISKK